MLVTWLTLISSNAIVDAVAKYLMTVMPRHVFPRTEKSTCHLNTPGAYCDNEYINSKFVLADYKIKS